MLPASSVCSRSTHYHYPHPGYDNEFPLPNWLKHLDEELDYRLVLSLRDGRILIGTLRSYDQYGNLLLESAYQRFYAQNFLSKKNVIYYSDAYLGCIIIRGESIVFFGRMKTTKETMELETEEPKKEIPKKKLEEETNNQNDGHLTHYLSSAKSSQVVRRSLKEVLQLLQDNDENLQKKFTIQDCYDDIFI